MKRYLAYDGINGDREEFDTIEEARSWLEECFLDSDEGYHPDFGSCKIYKLAETVECDVVDKKENYKYLYEDDIPEDDNESEAWPYSTAFDEIWKHRFVPVPSELLKQRDELREKLTEILAICDDGQELNMSNYNHDDVAALNKTYVEIFIAIDAAIKSTDG